MKNFLVWYKIRDTLPMFHIVVSAWDSKEAKDKISELWEENKLPFVCMYQQLQTVDCYETSMPREI